MTQTILTVTYCLGEPIRRDGAQSFRAEVGRVAPAIAGTPGLAWKIAALDAEKGVGQGVYLFDSAEAARAFAEGDLIAGLRARPGISDLVVIAAPVDRDLSLAMGAADALGIEPRDIVDNGPPATAA